MSTNTSFPWVVIATGKERGAGAPDAPCRVLMRDEELRPTKSPSKNAHFGGIESEVKALPHASRGAHPQLVVEGLDLSRQPNRTRRVVDGYRVGSERSIPLSLNVSFRNL
jgi:hypothetical protein